MLATEQILIKKAGLDFDSIMWDAQNNWPKHISWCVWLKHVQYAYEVVSWPVVESEIISKSSADIAAWVLQQHAPFEGVFGCHWIWKKPLEMYHTIISDLRSRRILAQWTIRALLLASFVLPTLVDQIGSPGLKKVTAVALFGTLILVMLFVGLAEIYNQITTFAKNL
jgi:hypothetical protein